MDRRVKFRSGLSSLYLPYYFALCEELSPEWQPYSGFRTFAEQTKLWNQGRVTPGGIVTNARAGESAHNFGCGSDWTIWEDDKPVWMNKADKRWNKYVEVVQMIGLRSGIEFNDIGHNELKLSCSWKHVLVAHGQGGMLFAQQKIEESMIR